MLTTLFWRKTGGAILRHVATVAAGVLLATGHADAETAEAIAGVLMGAGAVGLSVWEKRGRSILG